MQTLHRQFLADIECPALVRERVDCRLRVDESESGDEVEEGLAVLFELLFEKDDVVMQE